MDGYPVKNFGMKLKQVRIYMEDLSFPNIAFNTSISGLA
jgi:hypothetical protein